MPKASRPIIYAALALLGGGVLYTVHQADQREAQEQAAIKVNDAIQSAKDQRAAERRESAQRSYEIALRMYQSGDLMGACGAALLARAKATAAGAVDHPAFALVEQIQRANGCGGVGG